MTLDPAAANRLTYGPDTEFTVNFTNGGEHDEFDIQVVVKIEGGPEPLQVRKTVPSVARAGGKAVQGATPTTQRVAGSAGDVVGDTAKSTGGGLPTDSLTQGGSLPAEQLPLKGDLPVG